MSSWIIPQIIARIYRVQYVVFNNLMTITVFYVLDGVLYATAYPWRRSKCLNTIAHQNYTLEHLHPIILPVY